MAKKKSEEVMGHLTIKDVADLVSMTNEMMAVVQKVVDHRMASGDSLDSKVVVSNWKSAVLGLENLIRFTEGISGSVYFDPDTWDRVNEAIAQFKSREVMSRGGRRK